MRIFGLYIGSGANIDRLENALHSANMKVRDFEQHVGSLMTARDNSNEKLTKLQAENVKLYESREKAEASSKQFIQEVKSYSKQLAEQMYEVEKLVSWRNGDEFKKAGPKERGEFPSKLSEAFDAAAQTLINLQKYIAGK